MKGDGIMEDNGQAIISQQEQGVDGAGNKAHWSLRPWPLLLFFAIAGLFVGLLTDAINIPILTNSEYLAYHPYTLLLLDSAEWIFTIAAALCLFFFVRHQQRKHGLESASGWSIGGAFWVGIVLLAGSMVLIAGRLLLPLQSFSGEYRSQVIGAYIMILIDYFVGFIASGLSILSVSLYFPVLERRFGIVKAALVSCAVLAGFGFVSASIGQTATYFIVPQASAGLSLWNYAVPYVLRSFISSIATIPLFFAIFLITGRRIPGAWALMSAFMGFINYLTQWAPLIPKSIHVDAWTKFLIIHLPLNIVLFAISLAILWSLQRWKTFRAFWADAKMLSRRTQGDIID